MGLPSPATGTELYLAAIYEVLCDIRTALVGGGQEAEPESPHTASPFVPSVEGGPMGSAADVQPPAPESGLPTTGSKFVSSIPGADETGRPTKRTRARTPR